MKGFYLDSFGFENLRLTDIETQELTADEVRIEFQAFSLNYRDLLFAEGKYNPRASLPAIPLSDGAGVIIEIGSSVTRWEVGDRVMPIFTQRWIDGQPSGEINKSALGAGISGFQGVLREAGVFNENGIVAIPEHLSFEEAATLPCAAVTAWDALVVSGTLKAGESVVTLGSGGVSVFAIQFAKMFGAEIFSTSGSDEKLARLAELGADHLINYRAREDWDKAILELTDKKGVDHVVEVGGVGTLQRSLNVVKTGGHIALIGVLAVDGAFNPLPAIMKQVRLQGILVGSRAMFEDMNRAISLASMRPVIDKVFPFADVASAFEYMKGGEHFGKVVISRG